MLVQTRLVDFYVWGSAAVWDVPSHHLGHSFVRCCTLAFCITSFLLADTLILVEHILQSVLEEGCMAPSVSENIILLLYLIDTLPGYFGLKSRTSFSYSFEGMTTLSSSYSQIWCRFDLYLVWVACPLSLKASFCPWVVKFHSAVLWCGTIFIHCARHPFNLETHLLSWETFY